MKFHQKILIALCALILAACGAAESTDSPTASLKKFIEASKAKDVETTKKLLSKSTLAAIEKTAAAQNTNVDKVLLNDDGTPIKELPETRNEKISGDAATVEVKNRVTGDFETIPFVKEDGVWKIALDKFMREMLEKQKQAADAPPASADHNQPNEPANNINQ